MDKFKLCVKPGHKTELCGINIEFFQLTDAVNTKIILAELSS